MPLALVGDTAGCTHHVYDGEPLRPDSAPEDVDRLAALDSSGLPGRTVTPGHEPGSIHPTNWFPARPPRVDSAVPGSATRNGQLTSAKSQEGYGPTGADVHKGADTHWGSIPTGTVKPSPVPVTEASTTVEALDAGRVLGRV